MCVCAYMLLRTVAHRDQKRASELLELVLQVVVSCLMSVLGTKLGPSSRAIYALNQ